MHTPQPLTSLPALPITGPRLRAYPAFCCCACQHCEMPREEVVLQVMEPRYQHLMAVTLAQGRELGLLFTPHLGITATVTRWVDSSPTKYPT
ncbi:hypothetical protein HaLaN_06076 [Haematococcus lacustris]|uniref:Uncharacterized protein n=1 Tax=Haematococcus lacustris TaxID=44745 RepID=A0A699YV75_HAELA|nr:hypothetical protein HaLaN_06076 [Haematococcus lacustris]